MEQCFLYNICNHVDCESEYCLRKYKTKKLYKAALLSDFQSKRIDLKVDPDNTDLDKFQYLGNVEKNIKQFVQEGHNLFLHSTNCGNGKTSWSVRLLQVYLNKSWKCEEGYCKALFISVPRFLMALKENITKPNDYANYIKDHIEEADLVVWDDIAAKTGTDFEIDKLMSFIDTRLNLGKANIFTSNLNFDGLTNALGDRLASRIGRGAIDIEFHGADKRYLMEVR